MCPGLSQGRVPGGGQAPQGSGQRLDGHDCLLVTPTVTTHLLQDRVSGGG